MEKTEAKSIKSIKNIMKIKTLLLFVFVCAFSVFLIACQQAEVAAERGAGETVTVVDSRGVSVTVPYPVERIVCTLNSGLNDLYMLGAGHKVVGIDQWTYDTTAVFEIMAKIDERIKNREIPAVDGSVENIIAQSPDVVILWAESPEIEALEAQGIPVIGMQINDFDQVFWKLELLATITGTTGRFEEIKAYCERLLQGIESAIKEIPESSLKSSIFMWSEGQFAGGDSTGSDILKKSGLTNVTVDVAQENFSATMEQIIAWNPETVVMWHSESISPHDIISDGRWRDVSAVINEDILMLPSNFYCDLWTVKYINSIQIITGTFYPAYFAGIDAETRQAEFIEFLYGMKL